LFFDDLQGASAAEIVASSVEEGLTVTTCALFPALHPTADISLRRTK
jgi:hypothetical protein